MDEATLLRWMLSCSPTDQMLPIDDFTYPSWKTERMMSALVGALLRPRPPQLVLLGSRRYEHLMGTVAVTPTHIAGVRQATCRDPNTAVLILDVRGAVFHRYAPQQDPFHWRWYPLCRPCPRKDGELRIRGTRDLIYALRDAIQSMLGSVLNHVMLAAMDTHRFELEGSESGPEDTPAQPGGMLSGHAELDLHRLNLSCPPSLQVLLNLPRLRLVANLPSPSLLLNLHCVSLLLNLLTMSSLSPPFNLPRLPLLPNVSSLQRLPRLPRLPNLARLQRPSLLLNLPNMLKMPNLPRPSHLPSMLNMSNLPWLPHLPSMPSVSSVSSVSSRPNLPRLLRLPRPLIPSQAGSRHHRL
ncbi:hypothetical protein CspeluHIS016_0501350 [Cutaneotrichosporon spelunceum]|uniref:Uncharacterized protein n=1 Tax=Cutaneotrichosporon spelunceum TaxID=1672016 RepID=A0AAD3YDF1_9TREE|nr:hypothetical protein CspeluHIS016_0501350 [Cutaneotrichosporon spelunceum]